MRPQSKVADSKMADKRRKEELDWECKLMIELRSAVEQSFKRDFPRPDPSEHGPNTRGRQAVPNTLNRNEMRANFFLPQQIRQGPVLNPQPAQLVSVLFNLRNLFLGVFFFFFFPTLPIHYSSTHPSRFFRPQSLSQNVHGF